MGAEADRKVTEIEATRRALETDLRDLEARLPDPLRSAKSLVGLVLGSTALALFLLEKVLGKRSGKKPATEVVVRIVRDDL